MARPVTSGLRWLAITWPRQVELDQVKAALRAMNGVSSPRRRDGIVLRAIGRAGAVHHHVGVGERRLDHLTAQLRAAIPGIGLEPVEGGVSAMRSWRMTMSTRRRPLDVAGAPTAGRSLLTALATAGSGETVVVDVLLGPVRRPSYDAAPNSVEGKAVWFAPLGSPRPMTAPDRRALAAKQGVPGWRAVVRLGATAASRPRQAELLGRLAAALRTLQGPGAAVGFAAGRPRAIQDVSAPLWWSLALNAEEIVGLIAWPTGSTDFLPVRTVRSRSLPPSKAVQDGERVIGIADYSGRERPLSLPIELARQHLWLVGATGTGKSTVALNLAVADMAAGRAVVIVEPKGDLIRQVLERVPAHRVDDVVLLSPGDPSPVGFNPLANRSLSPEVIADGVVHVLKGLADDNLGPRSTDIAVNALLTLARQPEPFSLAHLPRLFTDAAFRRRLVGRVPDPLGISGFWSAFDGWSEAERSSALAPLGNKIRPFVVRPALRHMLGQVHPKFDIADTFTHRKIVLLSLNEGVLGQETAALLGAIFMSSLWAAAQRRAAIPPERRHTVAVYLDEWQRVLRLPGDLADVLTQARALGLALTVANQAPSQLPRPVLSAVAANARSRVVFGTSYDEAQLLVRHDDRLTPADVVSLGRFRAYASLMTADEGPSLYMSIKTLPPVPATTDPELVIARSRERYGVPGDEVDAELLAAIHVAPEVPDEGFGRRRRDGEDV